MKCDANKLFLAVAASFAVLWVVCSFFVVILPSPMMTMTGHMAHADFGMTTWTMSAIGFVIGLIAWSLLGGATAWLTAVIYNRLLR